MRTAAVSRASISVRATLVILVNLALIIIILAAAEVYARHLQSISAAYSGGHPAMCEPDDHRIWRYRSGLDFSYQAPEFVIQIRTNADRLRSEPIDNSNRNPLVLFIGDSFTFGWGVQENRRFSEVIRDKLVKELGRPIRIINAGHWMYTFDQQLVLLKELLTKYRPQVVVQGLYWPHLRTLFGHELVYDKGNKLISVAHPGLKVDEFGVLKFRLDWLERPLLNSQLVALAARSVLNANLVHAAADPETYMMPGRHDNDELWTLAGNLLSETAAVIRSSGAVYIPFYVPTNVEIAESFWSSSWNKPGPPDGIDVSLPFRLFEQMMSKMGEQLLDVTVPMREQGGSQFYFQRDPHWNEEGHHFVGEVLAHAVFRSLPSTDPTSRSTK